MPVLLLEGGTGLAPGPAARGVPRGDSSGWRHFSLYQEVPEAFWVVAGDERALLILLNCWSMCWCSLVKAFRGGKEGFRLSQGDRVMVLPVSHSLSQL